MMLNDYTVPNKELRVTMTMRFDSEALGAQSSSTDTAHKGIKPKIFNVSLVIPFADSDLLTEINRVAESVQDDGSLTIYDITDNTANSLNVRQVKFTDTFNVREAGNLKAWTVQFGLQEYQSVAEKVEQRQASADAEQQSADGNTVASAADETNDNSEAAPLTGLEKILSYVDNALA